MSIVVNAGESSQSGPSYLNCSSGQTCSTTVAAPVGVDVFNISLFDHQNGQGNLLASGSATQNIIIDQANQVAVTASGVATSASLMLSANPIKAGVPSSVSLYVNALDADGYTIVGAGNYLNTGGQALTFTVSKTDQAANGSGSTTLSASSVSAPAQNPITVSYNGGAIRATVFTLAASPAISGSLTGTTLDFSPTVVALYPIATNAQPTDIVTGSDGALWFTEFAASNIGRLTTDGGLSEYPVSSGSEPNGIAAGPDGNLWFTEINGRNVGRITPAGVVTEFSTAIPVSEPEFIVAGADGNLWFTDVGTNAIGRVSTAGSPVVEFPLTTTNATPFDIVAGPDGNLWFTELTGEKIGKITTNGVVTEYAVNSSFSGSSTRRLTDAQRHFPSVPAPFNSISFSSGLTPNATTNGPEYITSGPDGALWFTYQNYEAGRISTSGQLSYFPISPEAQPAGITPGQDGTLWFADDQDPQNTGAIGQLQLNGVVNEYEYAVGAHPYAFGITSGPDGNIWFTDAGTDSIGELVY